MIRTMRETDLEQVLELWLDTNIKAHDFIPGSYWRAQRETVGALLPQAEVLVWEEGAGILGFCGLNGGFLEGLFVRYGAQSRGIGRELLRAAKEGRNRLALCVYRRNLRAAAFYRREGFVTQREGLDGQTGQEEQYMVWERASGAAQ